MIIYHSLPRYFQNINRISCS